MNSKVHIQNYFTNFSKSVVDVLQVMFDSAMSAFLADTSAL